VRASYEDNLPAALKGLTVTNIGRS
jgi:hypothetical protein